MDPNPPSDAACSVCGERHAAGQTCPSAPGLAAAGQDPLLGAMVGSFRIQRLLGRGGMGAVYLAEHPVIGSRVAIKFLHESLAQNPELVGRFYDEARAVNLIGHENIVAIYDLALLPPGRYFIVMEHLEGRTLSALVRDGRPEQPLALDILAQLTDALQAAHERGVIHRDLKPENVFLVKRHDNDHFVKLVDFGIAKLGDRSRSGHTAAGMIVGTPEYMAPEQCDNRPVDARTDVYALGVMAYEVFTGHLPFSGASIAQVLLAQLRQRPRPPRSLRSDLHPAVERIVLQALEKNPEARFADMKAMGVALRAAREELAGGGPARAPADDRPAPAPAAPTVSGAPQASSAPSAPSPPSPPPPPSAPAVELAVAWSGDTRRVRVGQVSHGAVFLCWEGDPPPLFSRLLVPLRGDGRVLPLSGEVVRHVSPAQAAAWKMRPGFAVQLNPSTADERLAVEALAARLRAPVTTPAGDRETIDGATALQLLESLEQRAAAGHYELLDLPPDVGLPEAREKARGLRRQVEDLRVKLPPQAQVARAARVLERIEQAALVLGAPGERLLHDARRGNFRGVARCVTAGLPPAVVASRRAAFLAEHPGQEAKAQQRVVRSQVARKMGNAAAALAELEAALQADPLNLALHDQHAELERAARQGGSPG